MGSDDEQIAPFGVRAETGRLLPPLSDEAVDAFVDQEREPHPLLAEAQVERAKPARPALAAVDGDTDPARLEQTGWGIIFGPDTDPAIKKALEPLIEHRRAQGADPLVVYDKDGFRPRENVHKWLERHGTSLQMVAPAQDGVPFYLLIVAPPEVVPFEFQYTLDLFWAVGRLWFDTVAEFERYVKSVIDYEKGQQVPTARQVALFAPEHELDAATRLFVSQVAVPLRDGASPKVPSIGQRSGYKVQAFLGQDATKANLLRIYRGEIEGGPPALLLSGGHGVVFGNGHSAQLSTQGALVCQDWDPTEKIAPQHWFAGSDLPDNARVHGLIHVLFACYGGGVPELDNFDPLNGKPQRIAPQPFLARLPQKLLTHPAGGALATLAHIDRAWAYSFQGPGGNAQIQGFRDVLSRLLRGERIGQATDTFNTRWAGLSTTVTDLQREMRDNPELPRAPLKKLWIARDDARNFIVLGDPAVQLRVRDMN